MSYILDALKKAERERGIAQVPTLSTVHDLPPKPPVRLWAASALAVLCIAVVLWLFFFGRNSGDEVTPSLAEEAGDVLRRPDRAQTKSAVPADESSSDAGSLVSSTTSGFQSSYEMPALADDTGIKTADIERRGRLADAGKGIQSIADATRGLVDTDPLLGKDSPQLSAQEPAELSVQESKAVSDRVEETQPSAGASEEAQASLREAMDKMEISILFYSDNKAERLVFINGKKYVEGDTVEGNYLLESITSEGAVLSYDGERAILRPGRN